MRPNRTRSTIASVLRLSAASLIFGLAVHAGAVQPGDSLEDVRGELGRPSGSMQFGNTQVLTYERGEVELVDGVVVRADLISAEEARERRERREAEERERQERERQRREQLRIEGLEVYERKVNDPAFMNAPASERVAFWKRFQKQYPDVPLGEEYEQALREYEMEVAAQGAAAAEARRAAEMQQAQIEAEASRYRGPSYSEEQYWYQSPSVVVTSDPRYDRRYRRDDYYNPGVTYKEFHSTPGYAFQNERPPPPSTRPRPVPVQVPARPVTLPSKRPSVRPTPRLSR